MRPARLALLLLLPALAACPREGADAGRQAQPGAAVAPAQPAASASQAALLAELAGTHWRLAGGLPGHDPSAVPVTLAFEQQGRISGSGGCNGYGADIGAANGSVRIGPVVATKRGCPGTRNQVEADWFGALAAVERLERSDEALLLHAGERVLRLQPADP